MKATGDDGKANGEGQEGGELKDDRAGIAALRRMMYQEDRPARFRRNVELELSCSRTLCGTCCEAYTTHVHNICQIVWFRASCERRQKNGRKEVEILTIIRAIGCQELPPSCKRGDLQLSPPAA
jgi:hypothetical protein